MTGLTLDAGGLIAFERNRRNAVVLIRAVLDRSGEIAVPAGALAQVWRGGPRSARIARLLRADRVGVVELDHRGALAAGRLCGARGTDDVVDASVVVCARLRRHVVLTSHPGDLRVLDAALPLVTV
jgi:isoaspartyl peptidase/L-asparaginase-like protein (Ntn-hydrolase superfamily)